MFDGDRNCTSDSDSIAKFTSKTKLPCFMQQTKEIVITDGARYNLSTRQYP